MRKGFTLIELMIVVLIIGILAGIAIPKYVNITKKAQAARIVSDYRTIWLAVQMYLMETGEYPPDRGPGRIPRELRPYLSKDFAFNLNPAMAVKYDWDNWVIDGRPKHSFTGILYGISVTTKDMALINAIDEIYQGPFTYSLGNNYTFVIAFIPDDGVI